MAACLRSLRLGVPSLVPGGTRGGGRHLCRNGTRRGAQGAVQSAAALHISDSILKATPAPLQHQQQQQQQKVEGEGEGAAGWLHSSVLPFHNFDPLGATPCPVAHTVDDIEVQCARDNTTTTTTTTNNDNTSIRTFRLPANALWYPRDSKHQDGAILCSLTYSPIETEVINTIGDIRKAPHPPHRDKTEVEGGGYGAVCDMGLFIKSMGLRDGEVQLCGSSPPSSSTSSGKADSGGKPNAEQLSYVFNKLAETLPKLFIQPLDYTIYAQDIVFENRIRGVRTVGLFRYVRQVALLRTVGHLKFAYVKFEILKITKHPEEGTVKVRWRINGLSGLKAIVQFWKIKFWNWTSVEEQMVSWYDGFSTFYVGGDGLIHTHVADSMMPDEESKLVKEDTLAVKMAALLGLVHRPTSGTTTTTSTTTTEGLHHLHHTTATSTTTTTALLQQDKDCCAGLMLPLEKIH